MANKEKKEEELSKEELASIKADSELAEAKRLQKIEAEKAKKETKETYSKAEVQEMIDSALMKFKASQEGGPESLDEVDPFAQKTLTLARFPNKEGVWKFIVGFADTNTDEDSKEARYAFDIWNDLQKKNESAK